MSLQVMSNVSEIVILITSSGRPHSIGGRTQLNSGSLVSNESISPGLYLYTIFPKSIKFFETLKKFESFKKFEIVSSKFTETSSH